MNTELLAKSTGETLASHTISCLRAADALLANLPLPDAQVEQLRSDVRLAVALHDTGKAASGFQNMLRGRQRDWSGRRHEVLSAAAASALAQIAEPVILAVMTHHKGLPPDPVVTTGAGCLPWEQIPPLPGDDTPVWREMLQEWLENLDEFKVTWREICAHRSDLGAPDVFPLPSTVRLNPSWLVRGNGRRSQRRTIEFRDRYYASLVRGLTIAADHFGSANYTPPPVPVLASFQVLRRTARPFQELASETDGSALLRAPTGSGKTEASLLWAQRNQRPNGRLYYVLPYTASINAMYRRLGPGKDKGITGVFGPDNVGLLHSKATAALYAMQSETDDLPSKLTQQATAKKLSTLAREMWFPIRICTPHQVLRYVLRGNGWEGMLAEFPGACFVYDEVHAYDPRVAGLVIGTAKIASQWGARSLFVSATLPDFLAKLIRGELGEVPCIVPNADKPRDQEIMYRQRHIVTVKSGTLLENLSLIRQTIKSATSTLVVCNHVGTAQLVFDLLQEELGDSAHMLHSRFNPRDRNRIEAALTEGSLPKVLVATQAVEVSLDVDFEAGFSEPAPVDALAQRMGRVNRYGSRPPASIIVFSRQVSRDNLYCRCNGPEHEMGCRVKRSVEVLSRTTNPLSEEGLVNAVNEVYVDGYEGEDKQSYLDGLNHPDLTQFADRLLAGASQNWVEELISSTDGVIEVLPRVLVDEYNAKQSSGLWIEAASLLVQVRVRQMARIRGKLDTKGEPWILESDYSSTRGLTLD